MEDSEQAEEAAENNSTDEIQDEISGTGNASCTAFNDSRPRRSSILKKTTSGPVAKSVSFSSIPGEKKVTNGRKFSLLSSLKFSILTQIFNCFFSSILKA